MKDVVVANGNIKEIARLDPGRIVVVILGARSRDFDQVRSILRGGAHACWTDRRGGRRTNAVAGEARLELLIRR